jgi:3-oxoacyl-[acyl-carrier protein] reductase
MSKKRVVVVTGGGSGMGKAIAHKFADNGDVVFILGRNQEKLNSAAKGHNNLIKTIVADVTDITAIEKASQIIIKDYSKIDVLVNNAGGNLKIDANVKAIDAQNAWKQIIETNLSSVFNMIFVFSKHLTKPGGRIINITSMAALGGSRQGGITGQAYSAAKSGIHGLSRTLVSSLAADGITINCIAPGVITNTDFFGGQKVPDELANFYLPKIPAGRLGLPDEIAAGVFYLASEEANYITGEILNINGGAQFGR